MTVFHCLLYKLTIVNREHAAEAVKGISNGLKEECTSEDHAWELFNMALLGNRVAQIIPAVRKQLAWEDVYPGIPRPASAKK